MTNNFFDQDFFRYVDLDLFNEYLTQKQLQPIQTPDKKADKAQVMANHLADLYVDDELIDYMKKCKKKVELQKRSDSFSMELTSKNGVSYITEYDSSRDLLKSSECITYFSI